MKIDFVNPPRTFIDRSEIAPPLGLLRLAATGRSQGFEVTISDLNLRIHEHLESVNSSSFYDSAVEYLLTKDADVYCFTSMCVDSHVALHLARLLKERRSSIVTVLGGTHFTAIASDVLATYDWIDYVATGEGESVIENLRTILANVPRRSILRGKPKHQADASLPFDLIDRTAYFRINPNRSLDFESARGCRYRCSFCYSPEHYNGFRNFGIEETVAELDKAISLGFQNVFFVEDNFLNDPSRAIQLCNELRDLKTGIEWAAYVTFPELIDECIAAMSQAGCTAVFTGIDAVGTESRRVYKKAFVRTAEAMRARIRKCVDAGITPTCAFLLTPPSMNGGQNLLETLRLALTARNSGGRIRLNTVTIYNKTGLSTTRSDRFFDPLKTRLMLDVPPVVEDNPYAISSPELFPYHARYVGQGEWHAFLSIAHCLYTLFEVFPQSLDRAWVDCNVAPTEIARQIIDNIGKLIDIPKTVRRETELLASIDVIEQLAIGKREFSEVLEAESASVLQYI